MAPPAPKLNVAIGLRLLMKNMIVIAAMRGADQEVLLDQNWRGAVAGLFRRAARNLEVKIQLSNLNQCYGRGAHSVLLHSQDCV